MSTTARRRGRGGGRPPRAIPLHTSNPRLMPALDDAVSQMAAHSNLRVGTWLAQVMALAHGYTSECMTPLEVPIKMGVEVNELQMRVRSMRRSDALPLTTPGAGVRRPVKIDLPLGEQIIKHSERLDVGISDYMRGVLMVAVGAVAPEMQDALALDLPDPYKVREGVRLAS